MDGGRGVVLTDLRYQLRNKATQGREEKKQMSELNRILQFKSNPINSRFLIKSLIRCLVSQHRRHFFPSHIFFFLWHNSFPHLHRHEKNLSFNLTVNGLCHSYQPPASLRFLCRKSMPLFCSAESNARVKGVPRSSVPASLRCPEGKHQPLNQQTTEDFYRSGP